MLKEALSYLVDLGQSKDPLHKIGDQTYSERQLTRIPPHVDRPSEITINGLESAVKLIKTEIDRLNTTLFVQVASQSCVGIYTTYEADFTRNRLYAVQSDVPQFKYGFRPQENALIELRSQFIENDGTAYLLDLLSRISDEQSVKSNDNGMTQTVETKQGIYLKAVENVKPRVKLRPYRTFLEVEQPESEFLVRLDKDGNIGFFEADGGMWKMTAKKSIKGYFEFELANLIQAGHVVVMM
ncbi:MAG: hypothetical protein Q8873_00420 [Bacillota bacterium]|nr:hypothetical protein [Bacillota bacterium]